MIIITVHNKTNLWQLQHQILTSVRYGSDTVIALDAASWLVQVWLLARAIVIAVCLGQSYGQMSVLYWVYYHDPVLIFHITPPHLVLQHWLMITVTGNIEGGGGQ